MIILLPSKRVQHTGESLHCTVDASSVFSRGTKGERGRAGDQRSFAP